ncbi:MAG: hypothetical protein KUG69_10990 [Marinosulfonomonas sp.]|nr:hypothetical protein [Marinosulfonomonas sp.]
MHGFPQRRRQLYHMMFKNGGGTVADLRDLRLVTQRAQEAVCRGGRHACTLGCTCQRKALWYLLDYIKKFEIFMTELFIGVAITSPLNRPFVFQY